MNPWTFINEKWIGEEKLSLLELSDKCQLQASLPCPLSNSSLHAFACPSALQSKMAAAAKCLKIRKLFSPGNRLAVWTIRYFIDEKWIGEEKLSLLELSDKSHLQASLPCPLSNSSLHAFACPSALQSKMAAAAKSLKIRKLFSFGRLVREL